MIITGRQFMPGWPKSNGISLGILAMTIVWHCVSASAFYVSGNAPRHYKLNEPVSVYWNKIYPANDVLDLPYSYARMPFVCTPTTDSSLSISLGQRIAGDWMVRSDVQVEMGRNETCKTLCRQTLSTEATDLAAYLVRNQYMVEWFVDQLPGSNPWEDRLDNRKHYSDGFSIGRFDPLESTAYINNHFVFQFMYERSRIDPNQLLIIGFEIYPMSIRNDAPSCPSEAEFYNLPPQSLEMANASTISIAYTYSIRWIEEHRITWGERWEPFFHTGDDDGVHMVSLINAAVVLVLCVVITFLVLIRLMGGFRLGTFYEYDAQNGSAGDQDDTHGWKLLHGDVFRAPAHGAILASLAGTALQLMTVFLVLLVFSAIGIINSSYPGGLVTLGVLLYAGTGVIAGYISTRYGRTFHEETWMTSALRTAAQLPCVLVLLALLLDVIAWNKHAVSTLSFGALFALLALWLCLALPSTLVGAYVGSRQPGYVHPVRVQPVRREIPSPVWYMSPWISVPLAGIPGFGCIYLQEYLLLYYLWSDRFYYTYILLALCFIQLVIANILVTIIMTYLQLCNEDHRWWWRSFITGGSAGVYMFGYTVLHASIRFRLNGWVPMFVYLVRAFAGSAVLSLTLGGTAFLATYFFIRTIYTRVKVN